jgi:membrane-associated protease RseP (regulator of RpoE activity)
MEGPLEVSRLPGGPAPLSPPVADEPGRASLLPWLLAAICFVLTLLSTTTLGAVWLVSTRTDMTWELLQFLTPGMIRRVWSDPELLRFGFSFSLPALFILGCHELGHYLACRRYAVRATPPFFLPAPFGFGTLGAFIRMRGPLRSRRELFDIGFAGPAAGAVALLPFLFLGLRWSAPAAVEVAAFSEARASLVVPGQNLATWAVTRLFHGPLAANEVLNLHPFALAAWLGLLATALNLLPLGQLDGGHILYSAIGRRQHRLAFPVWCLLLSLTWLWSGWGVWSAIVFLLGIRHPPVGADEEPLGGGRLTLAILSLALLILSFAPVALAEVPVR